MNLTVESDALIVENESGAIRLSAEEAAKLILHARKVLNQLAQSSQGGPVRQCAEFSRIGWSATVISNRRHQF